MINWNWSNCWRAIFLALALSLFFVIFTNMYTTAYVLWIIGGVGFVTLVVLRWQADVTPVIGRIIDFFESLD